MYRSGLGWRSFDPREAVSAVHEIENPAALRQVIFEARNPEARRLALIKLGDKALMGSFALSDPSPIVRRRMARALDDPAVLEKILEEERSKGNYVIAAGDFNQAFSNTDISAYPLQEGKWAPGMLSTEDLEKEWQCLMDSSTPTCRSLDQPYEGADHSSFQYYVVDGFILSSNIEVISCGTQDLGFVYTDHNPVLLECALKQEDM